MEVNFTDNKDKLLLNEHSIPDSPTRYRLHLYLLFYSLLLQLFNACICLINTILFTGIFQYQQTFMKKFRHLRILMKVNLCNMYMIKSQKIYFRKYYPLSNTTKFQKKKYQSWSNKCRDILRHHLSTDGQLYNHLPWLLNYLYDQLFLCFSWNKNSNLKMVISSLSWIYWQ